MSSDVSSTLTKGSSDESRQLATYQQMFRIRLFEERCQALSGEGLISGSIHLCAAQEVVPIVAASLLEAGDRVVATYRGHGWAIACGVPLPELLAEICHRATGINGGRGGSAYLFGVHGTVL